MSYPFESEKRNYGENIEIIFKKKFWYYKPGELYKNVGGHEPRNDTLSNWTKRRVRRGVFEKHIGISFVLVTRLDTRSSVKPDLHDANVMREARYARMPHQTADSPKCLHDAHLMREVRWNRVSQQTVYARHGWRPGPWRTRGKQQFTRRETNGRIFFDPRQVHTGRNMSNLAPRIRFASCKPGLRHQHRTTDLTYCVTDNTVY